MQIVPLQAVPSQKVSVTLGGQACLIWVYQRSTGLYLDLSINDAGVIVGALCENRNRIVRSAYLGFAGDLAFLDTQGNDDPSYAGIGTRFSLAYFAPAELGGA